MNYADMIMFNGLIHTMSGDETASAVAVTSGRITAVGSDEKILQLCGDKTEKLDLKGACVLPGFNDSHCHLRLTGECATKLDLRGVASKEELVQRGREYLSAHPVKPGGWVVGYGFNHNLFPDGKLPDIETAQAISDTVPVLLDRVCGHVGTVNRSALRAAGYDETTVILGGVLDKDEDGKLNGILREAALDQIKMFIPKPDKETVMNQLRAVMARLNSLGISSAQSDDLEGSDLDTLLAAFRALEENGEMSVRVFEEIQAARVPVLERFLVRGLRTGDGSEWFRIGNIKLLTDGSLGARTAWLREDYCDDPGNRGVPVYTQAELDEVVLVAHSSGMQCAFHAIGDGAGEACISAIERAQAIAPGSLRDRIVHCQFSDPELFKRMASAGMAADIQPAFTASDYTLTASRMGAEREKYAYAWRSMLENGVHIAGGSDSPVETPDPLWGIYCAVTRQDGAGLPEGGWHPEERLSVREAVWLYTTGAAYVSFDENEKGTIEAGKLADLTVLSGDIFTVPPRDIPKLRVLRTIVGGKTRYTAD